MSLKSIREDFAQKKISKPEYIEKAYSWHETLFQFRELLSQTDVTKIEINKSNLVFYINHRALNFPGPGPAFIVAPKDQRAVPVEIFNFNSYEHDDFRMLIKMTGKCRTIFDVGGNIGYHSINLALKYPQAKIFCFEPIPETFSYLQRNVEINKIANVSVANIGLSDEEKTAVFYFYPECSGNASMSNLSARDSVQEIKAQLSTVDVQAQRLSDKVDFMKCDVEGAELFVFRGATKTLENDRPIVFSEILRKWSKGFDYDANEIFKFFASLKYSAFTVQGEKFKAFGAMTEETVETNFFFIPSERLKDFGL